MECHSIVLINIQTDLCTKIKELFEKINSLLLQHSDVDLEALSNEHHLNISGILYFLNSSGSELTITQDKPDQLELYFMPNDDGAKELYNILFPWLEKQGAERIYASDSCEYGLAQYELKDGVVVQVVDGFELENLCIVLDTHLDEDLAENLDGMSHAFGVEVQEEIDNNTKILVVSDDPETSLVKKAKEVGAKIIHYDEYYEMFRDFDIS